MRTGHLNGLRPIFGALLTAILLLGALAGGGAWGQAGVAPPAGSFRAKVLAGARAEAARHTPYIMQYKVLAYPGGDVPAGTGVCTDLVIRAFRAGGVDLQQELHEDRVAHASAYPLHIWENKRADKNIDHRRCQNLAVWFRRHARTLTTSLEPTDLAQWQGGDVVFFQEKGASHPWHVAVVSDQCDGDGMPLIIDSYPPWTSERHRLDDFLPIGAHFRYDGPAPAARPGQPARQGKPDRDAKAASRAQAAAPEKGSALAKPKAKREP